MDRELYDLCDWAEIEAIVYSEHDNPHSILGPHLVEDGTVFNTFVPNASYVELYVKDTDQHFKMELADEAGFYVVKIKEKKILDYRYIITYDNNTVQEIIDPYRFDPVIDGMDIKLFTSGIHYDIYNKLGAHPMKLDGIDGVLFAVWAPNAIRVSVVGDFNLWDGRRHPMRRVNGSGIYELFIPGLKEGELYKYEVKSNSTTIVLKADPYGYASELRPATASKVCNIETYRWKDKEWMESRETFDYRQSPMSIYEVHLGSFSKPGVDKSDTAFYNYRELAVMIAKYVKEMGYTHVEIMPIMEHPLDASWGYQVTGYYAPTARYGTPEDFMYFVDYMHKHKIGVILDWVPAHFPKDAFGLANFDGTCLYEHFDVRQGTHPHWGTLIYNYGRPEVANFLIANALFWADKYHVDGIRMDAVASMLYLDYGKKEGEWVANIYGGNENLEAVELLKNLSKVFKEKFQSVLLIAEESTAWEKVTKPAEDNGLGFDLKWNMGWMNDFLDYMHVDPLFRKGRQGELTFSLIYAYSEQFILVLSHDEVVHGKGSMINKMPGSYEQKFANLRVAYGYMMAHPGKKLLFMGQDIAQFDEWNENESIQWNLLEYDAHREMKEYVKALNHLYKTNRAFFTLDFSPEGFEWINNMDAERSIITFLRKTEKQEETMLVVCNFTPVVYESYQIGVPYGGKYKEIFNSDKEKFGGKGYGNPRLKYAKAERCDEREYSITITVPPLGISIFRCTPAGYVEEKEKPKAVKEKPEKIMNEKPKAVKAKSEKIKTGKGKAVKGKPEKIKTEKPKADKEKSEKIKTEKPKAVKAKSEKIKASKEESQKGLVEKRAKSKSGVVKKQTSEEVIEKPRKEKEKSERVK